MTLLGKHIDGGRSTARAEEGDEVRSVSFSAARTKLLSAGIVAVAVVVSVVLCLMPAVSSEWRSFAVLTAVALAGIIAGRQAREPLNSRNQPWNVHAIWLVPAVLLTDVVQFGILLALSVTVTLTAREQPLRSRLLVAGNSVAGVLVLLLADAATPSALWALLIGMPLLLAVSAFFAVVGPTAIGADTDRPAVFSDSHWAAIEGCAAVTGCLLTAAMAGHPVVGLAGIAPAVLAVFALLWPELTSQARTDAKTGLPNAGRWEQLSLHALSDCAARRRPAAVIIIDIDHFKSVNDTYGHLAGDRVLATVAAAIRGELGPRDLVGRFGGEEFVVSAVGLDELDAVALGERIRHRLASTRHEVTTRDGVRTTAGPITCTIGVASSEVLGYDHTTLLRRADAALAAGKGGGRNQVRRATTPAAPRPRGARILGEAGARPLLPSDESSTMPNPGRLTINQNTQRPQTGAQRTPARHVRLVAAGRDTHGVDIEPRLPRPRSHAARTGTTDLER